MLGSLKLIIYALLFTNGLSQLLQQDTWWFIQNVNLVFHEAGHIIFFLFGQFLYVLGGSLTEVLIPTGITVMFMLQQNWFSAACTSWWSMTAWLSVSIYATDAQERVLPLITGDINSHDWHWLLKQVNLLQYDDVVGGVFWFIALACLLFGAVLIAQDKHVKALTGPNR